MARKWRNGQKVARRARGRKGQSAKYPLSKWLIRLKISSIQTTFLWGNLPPKKKCNIHTAKLICAALKPPCLVEEISRAIQNLQSNKQRTLLNEHITAPAVPPAVLLEESCQGRSKKQGGWVKKKRVGGLEKQGGGLKKQGPGSNKQVVGGQKKGGSKKKVWGVKKNGRG